MGNFYERYEKLCIEKGVSPSRAAQDIGLSNAAASGWADGSKPRQITVRKIAEYFNVTVDYLNGKEEKETPAAQEGNGDDPVTMELLSMVNNATDDERQVMLEMLRLLKKQRKE